jgi:hypothetical protein
MLVFIVFAWELFGVKGYAENIKSFRGRHGPSLHEMPTKVFLLQQDQMGGPLQGWFSGSKDSSVDEPRRRRVMDAINQFRAEICAKMKDEHGKDFGSFEQCYKFMEDACNPGNDRLMDGDSHEVTTRKGYCREYFEEAEKKAEKKIDEEDRQKAEAKKEDKKAETKKEDKKKGRN